MFSLFIACILKGCSKFFYNDLGSVITYHLSLDYKSRITTSLSLKFSLLWNPKLTHSRTKQVICDRPECAAHAVAGDLLQHHSLAFLFVSFWWRVFRQLVRLCPTVEKKNQEVLCVVWRGLSRLLFFCLSFSPAFLFFEFFVSFSSPLGRNYSNPSSQIWTASLQNFPTRCRR